MSLEENVFELVVDKFCRRVVERLYLIAHHVDFLAELALRITGMKHDVCQNLYRLGGVLLQQGGIIYRMFFGGKGVELCAQSFERIGQMPSLAVLGTFECHVFAEVCYAVLLRLLVPAPGSYLESAIQNRRLCRSVCCISCCFLFSPSRGALILFVKKAVQK